MVAWFFRDKTQVKIRGKIMQFLESQVDAKNCYKASFSNIS